MQNLDSIREKLVTAFRNQRIDRGWTQAELARRAKIAGLQFHQSTIGKIEKGQRSLDAAEAIALANVLGLDLTSIVSDSANVESMLKAETYRLITAETALRSAVEGFFGVYEDLDAAVRAASDDGYDRNNSTAMKEAENQLSYARLTEHGPLNTFARDAYDYDYIENVSINEVADLGGDNGPR